MGDRGRRVWSKMVFSPILHPVYYHCHQGPGVSCQTQEDVIFFFFKTSLRKCQLCSRNNKEAKHYHFTPPLLNVLTWRRRLRGLGPLKIDGLEIRTQGDYPSLRPPLLEFSSTRNEGVHCTGQILVELWSFFINHQIEWSKVPQVQSRVFPTQYTSTTPWLPLLCWQLTYRASWLSLILCFLSPFSHPPLAFQWLLQLPTPLLVRPWTLWPLSGLCKDWQEPQLDWIILMHSQVP